MAGSGSVSRCIGSLVCGNLKWVNGWEQSAQNPKETQAEMRRGRQRLAKNWNYPAQLLWTVRHDDSDASVRSPGFRRRVVRAARRKGRQQIGHRLGKATPQNAPQVETIRAKCLRCSPSQSQRR